MMMLPLLITITPPESAVAAAKVAENVTYGIRTHAAVLAAIMPGYTGPAA